MDGIDREEAIDRKEFVLGRRLVSEHGRDLVSCCINVLYVNTLTFIQSLAKQ